MGLGERAVGLRERPDSASIANAYPTIFSSLNAGAVSIDDLATIIKQQLDSVSGPDVEYG